MANNPTPSPYYLRKPLPLKVDIDISKQPLVRLQCIQYHAYSINECILYISVYYICILYMYISAPRSPGLTFYANRANVKCLTIVGHVGVVASYHLSRATESPILLGAARPLQFEERIVIFYNF